MTRIRFEKPEDIPFIRSINEQAFDSLTEAGLQILHDKGCPFVLVLGHADYYPRFGFQPASRFNIRSLWEGFPDEDFMILVLDDKAMHNVSGVATFRDEFNDAL